MQNSKVQFIDLTGRQESSDPNIQQLFAIQRRLQASSDAYIQERFPDDNFIRMGQAELPATAPDVSVRSQIKGQIKVFKTAKTKALAICGLCGWQKSNPTNEEMLNSVFSPGFLRNPGVPCLKKSRHSRIFEHSSVKVLHFSGFIFY